MQIIGGVPREEVLSVAEEVMQRFRKLPENTRPGRNGGYFTIKHKGSGKRYFINEIGECSSEMDRDCFHYVQEKTERMCVMRIMAKHVSAWQSRNREKHEYGGAIVAPEDSKGLKEGRDLVGGFSGTYEHSEEAILLVIWMIFRWMTLEDARKITAISENQLLEPMLNVCDDLFDRRC